MTEQPQSFRVRQLQEKAKAKADEKAKELIRKRRRTFLVKAFVQCEGDLDEARERLLKNPGKDLAGWEEDSKWFMTVQGNAAEIMEENVFLNLLNLSMQPNGRALPSSKVILPALNKRRYNQQVQKQEVANEGLSDALKAVSNKPLSHKEFLTLVKDTVPELRAAVIDVTPAQIEYVPTLDEALAAATPEQLRESVIDLEGDEL